MNLIGRYWFSLKYFSHCISYLAWNSRQRIRPIPYATSSLLLHTSEVRHKLWLLKRMQWLVERNNWWLLRYKSVQNVELVLHLVRPRPLKKWRKLELVEELKEDNKSWCKAANNISLNNWRLLDLLVRFYPQSRHWHTTYNWHLGCSHLP